MAVIERDDQFWQALDKTNAALEPAGLYITHLFSDEQVIVRPEWLENIVPMSVQSFRYLRPFRPATIDLILTKMMRDDPQDSEDIEFLLRQENIAPAIVSQAFAVARCPDLPEIREVFLKLQPRVLKLAGEVARRPDRG